MCFSNEEGRKVGSLKRLVRSHWGRWEIKKEHAAAAGSAFPSQNSKKKTPLSEHFWKLRWSKSARRHREKVTERELKRERERETERERERETQSLNHLSIHQIISGFALPFMYHKNLVSHSFLPLKLLPPPCAVLLTGRYEKNYMSMRAHTYIYIYGPGRRPATPPNGIPPWYPPPCIYTYRPTYLPTYLPSYLPTYVCTYVFTYIT